jgi:hypothetical protein
MSLSVFASVSRNTVRLSRLLETHAYADSSTLTLLVTGSESSSDWCPSEIDRGALEERCAGMIALPLFPAAPTSESWLSIVAMNNPKAASDLSLSSLSALASLD